MAIMFAIGLLTGLLIASIYQRRKAASLQKPPQPVAVPPSQKPQASPIQKPSYLEDKIWYETELEFLFKFDEKLISASSLQDVIQYITEAAHDFLPIERTALLTWDKNSEKFTLACSIGWKDDKSRQEVGKDSISGIVVRNREALVVADLARDEYLKKLNKEGYLQKAFISVPLIYKDEVLGVLHVCDKRTTGGFTQRDVSAVMNIVRMGAIALQNARLFEQASRRAAELKVAYDELKEMQDKLVQAEKLKAIGQLASGVAHEMRNPIGIIMQGIDYLFQIIPTDEKEPQETLSMIKKSAQRADKIVISLLDFSRATKLELHPEYIAQVLEASLNLVQAELKDIEVARELQEGLPKVLVDKNKLMQVFINLFVNASHAMPQGGKLSVRAFSRKLEETISNINGRPEDSFKAGEEVIMVEIEDTGTGITEENLKKIFDPFFTTKIQGKGTGLGLSVCQNIIMLHKGMIQVRSQVGKGTTMNIILRINTEEGGANG